MIHIAIGTKAQFIKMAPVMNCLKTGGIGYNLIDLGQHSLITRELREEFSLDAPNSYLSEGRDISTLFQALSWITKISLRSLSVSRIKKEIFLEKKGVCLIHGDTISTLLGLYLAKVAGLKVAHIEAGLRSFCWFEPFPEEILRVIAMKYSDILFAPSQWALNNLVRMGLRNKTILLPGNTGQESASLSIKKKVNIDLGFERYCLVSFHRMENIFSRERLLFIAKTMKQISTLIPIIFVQHQPTINQLKKTGLFREIQEIKNMRYFKILSHGQFIHLLDGCSFVISDGGSIQEEAFYLGKPCLLLRRHTERNEGIGENVMLSGFDKKNVDFFIQHYSGFGREKIIPKDIPISSVIVEHLKKYA